MCVITVGHKFSIFHVACATCLFHMDSEATTSIMVELRQLCGRFLRINADLVKSFCAIERIGSNTDDESGTLFGCLRFVHKGRLCNPNRTSNYKDLLNSYLLKDLHFLHVITKSIFLFRNRRTRIPSQVTEMIK